MTMHILRVQLLSIIGLFLSMVLVFLFPYWWVNRKPDLFGGSRYETGVSLANCFSGGVFVATFFVGLMPEVRNMFASVFESYQVTREFPIAEFVIFLGFLLALGIEQCVLEFKEKRGASYSSLPSSGFAEDGNKIELNSTFSRDQKDVPDSNDLDYDSDQQAGKTTVTVRSGGMPNGESHAKITPQQKLSGHCHSGHGHTHDISQILQGEKGIRLGMLLVSLGVHSLFEGLALGLQTSVPVLVNLVIGVAIHELLVAFAMGVNVARLRLPGTTALKLAVIFSASIPAGQLLGLLIGHYQSNAAVAVSATLQGLAAGTFIHVTFLEVIPAEFSESGPRLLKVFFLGLGFSLLLACNMIMIATDHRH